MHQPYINHQVFVVFFLPSLSLSLSGLAIHHSINCLYVHVFIHLYGLLCAVAVVQSLTLMSFLLIFVLFLVKLLLLLCIGSSLIGEFILIFDMWAVLSFDEF